MIIEALKLLGSGLLLFGFLVLILWLISLLGEGIDKIKKRRFLNNFKAGKW
jgi:hypothetical protein